MERFENKDYSIILQEVAVGVKSSHWMWWAFPVRFGSWGDRMVSEYTRYYALQDDEVLLFIRIHWNYYEQVLWRLSLFNYDQLKRFFTHDLEKFKNHIHYFYSVLLSHSASRTYDMLLRYLMIIMSRLD